MAGGMQALNMVSDVGCLGGPMCAPVVCESTIAFYGNHDMLICTSSHATGLSRSVVCPVPSLPALSILIPQREGPSSLTPESTPMYSFISHSPTGGGNRRTYEKYPPIIHSAPLHRTGLRVYGHGRNLLLAKCSVAGSRRRCTAHVTMMRWRPPLSRRFSPANNSNTGFRLDPRVLSLDIH